MIQQNVKKGINIYKYYVSYKVSHMESYKNQPVFGIVPGTCVLCLQKRKEKNFCVRNFGTIMYLIQTGLSTAFRGYRSFDVISISRLLSP